MKHETPSEGIFNEIRDSAIKVWKDNYSDEFGYVTEKTDRINSLSNYEDNVMVCYRMFDISNQYKMIKLLSESAVEYIYLNN